MNIKGLITVGVISFLAIAGRASYLMYSVYETARLEAQERQIAQDVNHPSVKIRWIEHTLVLEGMVENQGERIRAEQIALAHLSEFRLRSLVQPPKVVNALTLSLADRMPSSYDENDVHLAGDFD